MEPPPRNSNQATIKCPDIVMMGDVPDGFGSEWSCGGCASWQATCSPFSSHFAASPVAPRRVRTWFWHTQYALVHAGRSPFVGPHLSAPPAVLVSSSARTHEPMSHLHDHHSHQRRISSGSSASSSRSRSPLAQLVAVGSPPFAARDTRSSATATASSLLQKQQQVDAPELARRAQRETEFGGYHVLMRVQHREGVAFGRAFARAARALAFLDFDQLFRVHKSNQYPPNYQNPGIIVGYDPTVKSSGEKSIKYNVGGLCVSKACQTPNYGAWLIQR
ncbi:hypothetical protein BDV93DRAFT_549560 [Ceratobasidium sp. AG-I]|nr:hypothetical protein BDV93DRAFT_549560 [Ceratobasidium sp. AG-I]